jgi:hypothetical protein
MSTPPRHPHSWDFSLLSSTQPSQTLRLSLLRRTNLAGLLRLCLLVATATAPCDAATVNGPRRLLLPPPGGSFPVRISAEARFLPRAVVGEASSLQQPRGRLLRRTPSRRAGDAPRRRTTTKIRADGELEVPPTPAPPPPLVPPSPSRWRPADPAALTCLAPLIRGGARFEQERRLDDELRPWLGGVVIAVAACHGFCRGSRRAPPVVVPPREAARRCKMEGGDAQAARERPAVWARRQAWERKRDVAAIRGEDGGGEAEEPREATALADARRMGASAADHLHLNDGILLFPFPIHNADE